MYQKLADVAGALGVKAGAERKEKVSVIHAKEDDTMNTETIREFREARDMEEANELLATGRWRVLKMDLSEDEPVITLVRVK